MDESKRIIVSFLRITGVLLVGFPIYVYFVNPTGSVVILPLMVSSLVIGSILIAVSIVI